MTLLPIQECFIEGLAGDFETSELGRGSHVTPCTPSHQALFPEHRGPSVHAAEGGPGPHSRSRVPPKCSAAHFRRGQRCARAALQPSPLSSQLGTEPAPAGLWAVLPLVSDVEVTGAGRLLPWEGGAEIWFPF